RLDRARSRRRGGPPQRGPPPLVRLSVTSAKRSYPSETGGYTPPVRPTSLPLPIRRPRGGGLPPRRNRPSLPLEPLDEGRLAAPTSGRTSLAIRSPDGVRILGTSPRAIRR